MAQFAADGCWTWFNRPQFTYYPSIKAIIGGWVDSSGSVVGAKYYTETGILQTSNLATAFQDDDHANPTVGFLDPLSYHGRKCLGTYSGHNDSNQKVQFSQGIGGVSQWRTSTTLGSAATYSQRFQMGDTNRTLLWFFRNGLGASGTPWTFRSSSNGGEGWITNTDGLLYNASKLFYPIFEKTADNRVDCIFSRFPGEALASVYHFYIIVASDGSRTYYQTDGTLIGDDTTLPLDEADCTLVYNGSVTNSWVWDVAMIGGAPCCAFVTFGGGSSSHTYWRGKWNGTSWDTESIVDGGSSTPNYLFAGEVYYSGGICLDPNNSEIIYCSRKYADGDFRLEQYTKSGTWSKTADVSGNTSSVNGRPCWVRGYPTTQIMWWQGTYTNYLAGFTTAIHSYPDLTINTSYTPVAKPTSPALQAGEMEVAGCLGLWPFHEGSGTTVSDIAKTPHNGTIVGSPVWANGSYGPELGSFSTSNYVQVDPSSQLIGTGVYPFYIAVLVRNSSTSDSFILGQGRSADGNGVIGVRFNDAGVAQAYRYFLTDNSGSSASVIASSVNTNDGVNHVAMVVSWSAIDHRLYFDGVLKASGTTSLGVQTDNQLTFGVLRRSTIAFPFTGTIVGPIQIGSGIVPDPGLLAHDWLSGKFKGITPNSRFWLFGTKT